MVVGRFQVMKIDDHSGPNHEFYDMELQAVYDNTLPEDRRYAAATPVGKVNLGLTSPGVVEEFRPLNKPIFCVFMSEDEYRNFEVSQSQPNP